MSGPENTKLSRGDYALTAVLIIAVGAFAFLLFRTILRTYSRLSPQAAAATATGAGTVLLSVITLIVSKRFEHRAQIQQDLRKEKLPVYKEFVEFLFQTIAISKVPDSQDDATLTDIWTLLTQSAILWASDDVLKAYTKFARAAMNVVAAEGPGEPGDPWEGLNPSHLRSTMEALEQTIYAIRKDLGHNNRDLASGELLGLFLSDVDHLMRVTDTSHPGH
jgi:hypothetical protein